jgi:hypothetical protein
MARRLWKRTASERMFSVYSGPSTRNSESELEISGSSHVRMSDFWSDVREVSGSEGDVENRLVIPMLLALGYGQHEIHAKVKTERQVGRTRGRFPEADFLVAPARDARPGWIVVEAKSPRERIDDEAIAQGRTYSQIVGALYLVVTNGVEMVILDVSRTFRQVELWRGSVEDLCRFRSAVESYLAREPLLKRLVEEDVPGGLEKERFDRHVKDLVVEAAYAPLVTRVLRSVTGETYSIDGLGKNPAWLQPGTPIYITGKGGRGKSSLARLLVLEATRASAPRVPLVISARDVDEGIFSALRASLTRHPTSIVSDQGMRNWLDTVPSMVIVDDWDRATDVARAETEKDLRSLTSSPCVLVILARPRVSPPALRHLAMDLDRYTTEEFVAAARTFFGSDEAADRFMDHLDEPMRELLHEPVILAQYLDLAAGDEEGEKARPLAAVLHAIFVRILRSRHSHDERRSTELSAVLGTVAARGARFGLQDLADGLRQHASSENPAVVADELIEINVLGAVHSGIFEFAHELWRLYFLLLGRLSAAKTAPNQILTDIGAAELSLAGPVAAGLIDDPTIQAQVLDQLLPTDFEAYLTSTRARLDCASRMLPKAAAMYRYQEILGGLVTFVDVGTPGFRDWLHPWTSPVESGTEIGIVGYFDAGQPRFGEFALVRRRPEEPRIRLVDQPVQTVIERWDPKADWQVYQGELRSAAACRLFGLPHVVDSIKSLVGRYRLPVGRWTDIETVQQYAMRFCPKRGASTLQQVIEFFEAEADEVYLGRGHVSTTGGQKRAVRLRAFASPSAISAEELVAMAKRLDSSPDVTISDLGLPTPEVLSYGESFELMYSIPRKIERLRAFFRAVVDTYREVCDQALPILKQAGFYSLGPVRAVAVVPRERERGIMWWWEPVESWDTDPDIRLGPRPDHDSVFRDLELKAQRLGRQRVRLGVSEGRVSSWVPSEPSVLEFVCQRLLLKDLAALPIRGRTRPADESPDLG